MINNFGFADPRLGGPNNNLNQSSNVQFNVNSMTNLNRDGSSEAVLMGQESEAIFKKQTSELNFHS